MIDQIWKEKVKNEEIENFIKFFKVQDNLDCEQIEEEDYFTTENSADRSKFLEGSYPCGSYRLNRSKVKVKRQLSMSDCGQFIHRKKKA